MTYIAKKGRGAVLERAQFRLGMTQKELGALLGVSAKTMMRWQGQNYRLGGTTLATLAARVFPLDPVLAKELAESNGTTLDALGVEAPAPAPAATPGEPPAVPALVETLLFAAADAADVSPRAMRPALLAAFERAARAGVTIEEVVKLLKGAS